jgi:hypothetical protein
MNAAISIMLLSSTHTVTSAAVSMAVLSVAAETAASQELVGCNALEVRRELHTDGRA